MNNSFVVKGNICHTKNSKELDLHENAYVVCVDGLSKGVFDVLPEETVLIATGNITGLRYENRFTKKSFFKKVFK